MHGLLSQQGCNIANKGETREGSMETRTTSTVRATIKPGFYLHLLLNGFTCAMRNVMQKVRV